MEQKEPCMSKGDNLLSSVCFTANCLDVEWMEWICVCCYNIIMFDHKYSGHNVNQHYMLSLVKSWFNNGILFETTAMNFQWTSQIKSTFQNKWGNLTQPQWKKPHGWISIECMTNANVNNSLISRNIEVSYFLWPV